MELQPRPPLKKVFKKLKKPLDKPQKVWYNEYVIKRWKCS